MYPQFQTLIEKLVMGVDMPMFGIESYREVYHNPTLSELVEVMDHDDPLEWRAGALFTPQGIFVWNRQNGPTHETIERNVRRHDPKWNGPFYPTMIYYTPKDKELTIKHATWNSRYGDMALDQFESALRPIMKKYAKVFAPFSSIRVDEE